MRFPVLCAVFIAGAVLLTAQAQAPAAPVFQLRGDRFAPLVWEQMTPEQKTMTNHVLAGDRGSMNGPYNVMLRSPEMGDLAQQFGAYTRFHSSLPQSLNEFAILLTARWWTSQYVWFSHREYALKAGLDESIINAVAARKRPTRISSGEETVYNFCTELLDNKQVSDGTFKAAVAKFGERGVVDLIGVMGYYNLVSMLLNVDRYPLPPGNKPELSVTR